MAHKKDKYDSSCYYKNKLLEKCTVSDGEAFSALMEACDSSAKRILQEYKYFSPELKGILEKLAGIQEQEAQKSDYSQSSSIFSEPKNSLWGKVQNCDTLCPGVFMVDTASHGGVMFSKDMSALLSPTATKYGEKHGEYICFEEDTNACVALRELLDKKLWSIPENVKDKAGFEENINKSLKEFNPDYWRARQTGIENAEARKERSSPKLDERI